MKKYFLIGGIPYRSYTGTGTFVGLKVVGQYDSIEEVETAVKLHYEECGGLLMVLDSTTGQELVENSQV